MIDAALSVLNRMWGTDPSATHALMCNRVPCNAGLADDPAVVVADNPITGLPTVGLLGVVNGILAEAGEPVVEMAWSLDVDDCRRHEFLGFRRHPR